MIERWRSAPKLLERRREVAGLRRYAPKLPEGRREVASAACIVGRRRALLSAAQSRDAQGDILALTPGDVVAGGRGRGEVGGVVAGSNAAGAVCRRVGERGTGAIGDRQRRRSNGRRRCDEDRGDGDAGVVGGGDTVGGVCAAGRQRVCVLRSDDGGWGTVIGKKRFEMSMRRGYGCGRRLMENGRGACGRRRGGRGLADEGEKRKPTGPAEALVVAGAAAGAV